MTYDLSTHWAEEIVEARGCEDLYPPPHPSDLGPVEETFSKVEEFLSRARRAPATP